MIALTLRIGFFAAAVALVSAATSPVLQLWAQIVG